VAVILLPLAYVANNPTWLKAYLVFGGESVDTLLRGICVLSKTFRRFERVYLFDRFRKREVQSLSFERKPMSENVWRKSIDNGE